MKRRNFGNQKTIREMKRRNFGNQKIILEIKRRNFGNQKIIREIKRRNFGNQKIILEIKRRNFGNQITIREIRRRNFGNKKNHSRNQTDKTRIKTCNCFCDTPRTPYISRRRKNENVCEMSKNENCTCKACKNTVFHCQVCKFVTFLLLSSSWLLKLPTVTRTARELNQITIFYYWLACQ